MHGTKSGILDTWYTENLITSIFNNLYFNIYTVGITYKFNNAYLYDLFCNL